MPIFICSNDSDDKDDPIGGMFFTYDEAIQRDGNILHLPEAQGLEVRRMELSDEDLDRVRFRLIKMYAEIMAECLNIPADIVTGMNCAYVGYDGKFDDSWE